MPIPTKEQKQSWAEIPESGQNDCVQCGFCCKKCACPFGEWDGTQCKFLKVDEGSNYAFYECEKYDYIKGLPAEYGAAIAPAFGTGCCMSLFNTDREHNIHALGCDISNRSGGDNTGLPF